MVRIHRKLESDTLHLPELKPLIGRTVEITVEETTPSVSDQFWAELSRQPESEAALAAQKEIFRAWRSDSRFTPYWHMLDELLNRTLEHVRKWAAIQALLPLIDYDYDALRDQEKCDIEDARRLQS